jgi:Tol biopolymer transport system component
MWSNSGQQVAYFSYFDSCNDRDKGIYIAPASGGVSRRKLPITGAYYQWLPGDTQLIVNTGFVFGGELVIYNLNTDSVTPLGIQTRFPIFDVSRDGRFIYYEGEPVPPHQGSSIFEYDRQTGAEWAVAAGATPGISPNGEYLAYVAGPLFLYKFDDSTVRELTPSGLTPEWTPDELRIVSADGIGKIFVTDLAGSITYLIGEHSLKGAFGPISLSPNGQRILFTMFTDGLIEQIWEISIDGGEARQFTQ